EARRLEAALRKTDDHANLARALESRLARAGQGAGSGPAVAQDLLDRVPDAATIYADLGRLYQNHLGRIDHALDMRPRSLMVNPTSTEAHDAAQRLAQSLGKTERYEERVQQLAEAATSETAADLFVRLAHIAANVRRNDRAAASLYERAAAVHSNDRTILD